MNAYSLAAVFLILISTMGVITGLNLRQIYQIRLEQRQRQYRDGNGTFRMGPTTPKPAIEPKGQRPGIFTPIPTGKGEPNPPPRFP
jgi:hypothetical protein